MSFDIDPNEQASISGADLAIMCDEIKSLKQQRNELLAALKSIAALDSAVDSKDGWNEWGEAECFDKAQNIANAAISKVEGKGDE